VRHAPIACISAVAVGLLLSPAKATAPEAEQISIGAALLFLRVPEQPAPGKPWLWVAEFFGVDKELEDALFANGWYIAYVRVAEQFGSPWSMDQWAKAYDELHRKRGLAAKPAVLALSRGDSMRWLGCDATRTAPAP